MVVRLIKKIFLLGCLQYFYLAMGLSVNLSAAKLAPWATPKMKAKAKPKPAAKDHDDANGEGVSAVQCVQELTIVVEAKNNRGGDLAASRNFFDWFLDTERSNRNWCVNVVVHYDERSTEKVEKYRQALWNSKEGRVNVVLHLLNEDPSAIERVEPSLFCDPKVKGIVAVPNPHRLSDESDVLGQMSPCLNTTRKLYTIFEYNYLLSRNGYLNKIREKLVPMVREEYVETIQMGLGVGPDALASTGGGKKAGVFLPAPVAPNSNSQMHELVTTIKERKGDVMVGYFYSSDKFEGQEDQHHLVTVGNFMRMALVVGRNIEGPLVVILPSPMNPGSDTRNKIIKKCNEEQICEFRSFNARDHLYTNIKTIAQERKVYFVELDGSGSLEQEDFQQLVNAAMPLAGSTGDASFIEYLLQGKLVLYQAMRWKTKLLEAFVRFVRVLNANARDDSLKLLSEFYNRQVSESSPDPQSHRVRQEYVSDYATRDEAGEALVTFYREHTDALQAQARLLADELKKRWDIKTTLSDVFGGLL